MNEINLTTEIDNILSRKENKAGIHIKDITLQILQSNTEEEASSNHPLYKDLYNKTSRYLSKQSKVRESRIIHVNNPKTGKNKKGFYRIKTEKLPPLPRPINEAIQEEANNSSPITHQKNLNLYLGKAGECAVMSELLFRGYNVNSMLVDEGVDIVASKNNIFYYIQVKTSFLTDKGKIYATINPVRYNDFIGTQIRYIIVARCTINGMDSNHMFVFDNKDINKFEYNKTLLRTENGINIKIRFDQNRKPVLYDKNYEDASFYLNRFDF